jgi:hypothetical protein
VTGDHKRQFHADMVRGAERLKREVGYNASRFIQMVGELGGVGAAQQLLQGPDSSDGFTTLWEHGRWTSVLRPTYCCRGTASCSRATSSASPNDGSANTASRSMPSWHKPTVRGHRGQQSNERSVIRRDERPAA